MGFAKLHNDLVKVVSPVLNIKGGLKIGVTQTSTNTIISFLG